MGQKRAANGIRPDGHGMYQSPGQWPPRAAATRLRAIPKTQKGGNDSRPMTMIWLQLI